MQRLEDIMNSYLVEHRKKVNLSEWGTAKTEGYKGEKDDAIPEIEKMNAKLESLQELLYAEGKHKLLIILQGMDTSGKDGVIRHVFDGVNPQGVRVACFKVPTPEELSHDYLWRIHKQIPAKGEVVIFNRSHYEDVLVVRVLGLVPPDIWKKRYDQINEFERMLSDEGTTILKFYLHISKEEQRQRLLGRLDDPSKHWKFNPGDLETRAQWEEYMNAYEDLLEKTNTQWAPWFIIPADRKWFRDLLIARILVDKLESLDMKYPQPTEGLEKYRKELRG
jgi:PPK2 family polyphosphate:nucleotide phosphotransferase